MLDSLITEYTRIRVSWEQGMGKTRQDVVAALRGISDYMSQHEWKCNPTSVTNHLCAMFAFFDMSENKIGGDNPAFLCYYFSTLVAKSQLPLHWRLAGNEYRAFMVFKNMKKWDHVITTARLAPMAEYKGRLDENSFLDILLLGDVYQAWDVDPDSAMFANLKMQAPDVARNHPSFTKQQVIKESGLAHEALFRIIELTFAC